MEQALIELAKQIAKLQEENDTLKLKISKPTRKKKVKIDVELERMERVSRWVSIQYSKGFNEVVKKNKERLTQIRIDHPAFIPINDCMDNWPNSNTGGC